MDEIVKSRQQKAVDEGIYNDSADKNAHTSKSVMYWKSGGKYFGLVVMIGMVIYLLYSMYRKKN